MSSGLLGGIVPTQSTTLIDVTPAPIAAVLIGLNPRTGIMRALYPVLVFILISGSSVKPLPGFTTLTAEIEPLTHSYSS